MCGIVGYIGHNQAYPYLIGGLKKLEYRGYDSAGIALHKINDLQIVKKTGKVAALEEAFESQDKQSTLGIGHTRWATHGIPSDANSHPHYSNSGNLARSEEHTSELQSRENLVCRLLLEKK